MPEREESVSPQDLRDVVQKILQRYRTPAQVAEKVAHVLVDADCTGYPSHGVALLEGYLKDIADEKLDPAGIAFVKDTASGALHADAQNGWGHAGLIDLAVRVRAQARVAGICIGTLVNASHIGRMGYYVELLSRDGCIGMGTTASAFMPDHALVSATGEPERHLGSNPFAAAFPVEDHDSFVFDASTAAVSYFKLRQTQMTGQLLETPALIATSQMSSYDPAAFDAGGAIRPESGHKGLGASIVSSLLCALGKGAQIEERIRGTTIIAIDPETVSPGFSAQCGMFLEALANLPFSQGIPGWRAAARRREAEAQGIRLGAQVISVLSREIEELGLPIPKFLQRP
ncbi:MAG: hypothetical protein CVU34_16635 [Betaproteobacteria bacterium HGW-Betaproteobacteria-7]|jgi:uncharacterized oxidoreductase|nr:MAG: hypothetical protein CVU34_16635 [Betaproteobacteria bacterium HGW-Betaproteobacteria-7]